MAWIEVNLKTKRENEELLSAVLMDMGLDGLTIEDDKLLYDLAQDESRPGLVYAPDSYSDYIIIKAFFDEVEYERTYKARLEADLASFKDQSIKVDLVKEARLEDQDWSQEWMKEYKPIQIKDLVVVPAWEDYEKGPDQTLVRINPGMAFGTGDHATTAMCLSYIQDLDLTSKRVLDMGCGSGILSIAAEKLGAGRVDAVDYDLEALKKARENIHLNGCEKIQLIQSDLTANIEGNYDLALVNIIAEVIVRLLEDLHEYLHIGAGLVFTGILVEKRDMVLEALETRYEVKEIKKEDGWLAIGARCIDVS